LEELHPNPTAVSLTSPPAAAATEEERAHSNVDCNYNKEDTVDCGETKIVHFSNNNGGEEEDPDGAPVVYQFPPTYDRLTKKIWYPTFTVGSKAFLKKGMAPVIVRERPKDRVFVVEFLHRETGKPSGIIRRDVKSQMMRFPRMGEDFPPLAATRTTITTTRPVIPAISRAKKNTTVSTYRKPGTASPSPVAAPERRKKRKRRREDDATRKSVTDLSDPVALPERKRKRGRPRKDATKPPRRPEDTDSARRKPGRPRKNTTESRIAAGDSRPKYPLRERAVRSYAVDESSYDDDESGSEGEVAATKSARAVRFAKSKPDSEKKMTAKEKREMKRQEKLRLNQELRQKAAPFWTISEQRLYAALSDEEVLDYKLALKRAKFPNPATKSFKAWKQWEDRRRSASDVSNQLQTSSYKRFNAKVQSIKNHLFSPDVDTHLKALFHLTRAHLTAGNIGVTLKMFHTMLNSSYGKAQKIALCLLSSKDTETDYIWDDLVLLREKIAGIWCLYAHMFLLMFETDLAREYFSKRVETLRLIAVNDMEESLWDYAIALLLQVTMCPLVGNHAAITVALSRLRLKQRQRGQLRKFPVEDAKDGVASYFANSRSKLAHWLTNLEEALQICRDGMQRSSPAANGSHAPPLHAPEHAAYNDEYEELGLKDILGIDMTTDRVCLTLSTLARLRQNAEGNKKIDTSESANDPDGADLTPQFLSNVINAAMDLPRWLERSLRHSRQPSGGSETENGAPLPYLFVDPVSTATICAERNCLSHLKEYLDVSEGSEELRLANETMHSARRNMQGPYGVAIPWDSFLFFQSMNVMFVGAREAFCDKKLELHLSNATGFFRLEPLKSQEIELDSIRVRAELQLPAGKLYEDATYSCPECTLLLTSKVDYDLHCSSCRSGKCRPGFRDDSLDEHFDDSLAFKDVQLFTSGLSRRTIFDVPTIRYFDVECACSKCSPNLVVNSSESYKLTCYKNTATSVAESIEVEESDDDKQSISEGESIEVDDSDDHKQSTREGEPIEVEDSDDDEQSTREGEPMEVEDSDDDKQSTREGGPIDVENSVDDKQTTREGELLADDIGPIVDHVVAGSDTEDLIGLKPETRASELQHSSSEKKSGGTRTERVREKGKEESEPLVHAKHKNGLVDDIDAGATGLAKPDVVDLTSEFDGDQADDTDSDSDGKKLDRDNEVSNAQQKMPPFNGDLVDDIDADSREIGEKVHERDQEISNAQLKVPPFDSDLADTDTYSEDTGEKVHERDQEISNAQPKVPPFDGDLADTLTRSDDTGEKVHERDQDVSNAQPKVPPFDSDLANTLTPSDDTGEKVHEWDDQEVSNAQRKVPPFDGDPADTITPSDAIGEKFHEVGHEISNTGPKVLHVAAQLSVFELEYACRAGCVACFGTEAARNSHELECSGRLSSKHVDLGGSLYELQAPIPVRNPGSGGMARPREFVSGTQSVVTDVEHIGLEASKPAAENKLDKSVRATTTEVEQFGTDASKTAAEKKRDISVRATTDVEQIGLDGSKSATDKKRDISVRATTKLEHVGCDASKSAEEKKPEISVRATRRQAAEKKPEISVRATRRQAKENPSRKSKGSLEAEEKNEVVSDLPGDLPRRTRSRASSSAGTGSSRRSVRFQKGSIDGTKQDDCLAQQNGVRNKLC